MVNYLTRREKEVLEFIKDFAMKNGFAPSLDEIREGLGLSSVSTVHEHISKLVSKGFLARHPNKARSVQLKQPGESPELPITTIQHLVNRTKSPELGKLEIASVVPSEAGCVAVIVQGNSLVNEGVMSGDYLIVVPGAGLMEGDIMVGLMDGFKPVMGRIYHFGTKAIVKPIQEKRDSMVIDPNQLVVVGRVKGVIRSYL